MNTNNNILTPKDGLAAMFMYWKDKWSETGSGSIACTINDISLVPDGRVFDVAAWYNWLACIKIAQAKNIDHVRWADVRYDRVPGVNKPWVIVDYDAVDKEIITFTASEGFAAMYNFWDEVCERSGSQKIHEELQKIKSSLDDHAAFNETWGKWLKCVKKSKAGEINNYINM